MVINSDNFSVKEGYFYTFDVDVDALVIEVDNGNYAYTYPLDTVLYKPVVSMEYDGINFWSLQPLYLDGDDEQKPSTSMVIKRWRVENYICKLKQTFNFEANSSHKYNADAFTVEHYHTTLSKNASQGDTVLYLNKYYNNIFLIEGATLFIGPNALGKSEEVVVDSVLYGGVRLTSSLQHDYAQNTSILFHKHLFMFNNYNGSDETSGALYKFDSHSGFFKEKYGSGVYKDVKAATFTTIDIFKDVGEVDALLYLKGPSILFLDVSTINKTYVEGSTYDDEFTGTNGSLPDSNKWVTLSGSLTINNNTLRSYSTSETNNTIISKYYTDDYFEVTVSGSIIDSNISSGEYYQQSLGLLFPQESNRYCIISRGYSTEFGSNTFSNFSVVYRKETDTVASGISTNATNYILGMRRNQGLDDTKVSFFYKTVESGIVSSETTLYTVDMYDTEAQFILSVKTDSTSSLDLIYDNFIFTRGRVYIKSFTNDLPYYGSAYVSEIVDNDIDFSRIKDLSVDSGNIYILTTGHGYILSPMKSFIAAIALTASPAVLPADSYSKSIITAYVTDQYLQPIVGRRVSFDANLGDISGPSYVNTDENGKAVTELTAGTQYGKGLVTARAPQT